MQDEAIPRGEAASEWLREHFAGQDEPAIDITWEAGNDPQPGAYQRLLEILFLPREDEKAA